MSSTKEPAPPGEDLLVPREPLGTQDHEANPDARSISLNREPEKAIDPKGGYGDVPDGGFSAWAVVLGAWCASFCSFGWLNSKTGF